MFKSQGGKFSSVFRTSKDEIDHQNSLAYRELSSKKAFKILFDCLPRHLLSGRKVPYLLQLMVAAENNFQSNY